MSSFCSKGKRTAWKAWSDEYTEAFKSISRATNAPPNQSVIDQLERCTLDSYNCGNVSGVEGVNQARRHYLFTTANKPLTS